MLSKDCEQFASAANPAARLRAAEAAPVRIGVVLASASRNAGGLFNSVRQGALALRDAGCTVDILAIEDEHSDTDAAAWAPLPLHLSARRGPVALGYSPDLGHQLRSRAFDLLHQHGLWQHISRDVSRWRRRTGGPIMISPRGMLDPWALRFSAWKKRIARALFEDDNLKSATCLHALNRAEAEAFRAFGLGNPIAVIPNGISVSVGSAPPPAPDWLPANGCATLSFIGRLHKKKGVLELVRAWAQLSRSAPSLAAGWRLVIAGWGDEAYVQAIAQAVRDAGLERSVLLPGPVFEADKAALLAHSAAFILPSYSEGLPMAVLEAWAYALPVFMTRACNLPDGFDAGAAIEIKTDSDEMARRLAERLPDPALGDLGTRGRLLVAERYEWPRIAQQHIEVYRWMLEGGPTPETLDLA